MSNNHAYNMLQRSMARSALKTKLKSVWPPKVHVKSEYRALLSYKPYSQEWHHQENDARSNYFSKKSIFVSSAALLSFGVWYTNKKNCGVTVYAAEKEQNLPKTSRRRSFNFVADVVDQRGSAVVYIERLARIPFRSKKVPISHGSGFLVEEDGLIITNAHVVGNQSKLTVRLHDGREFEGQVLGVHEGLDLAAVKINCQKLAHFPLGSSKDIRPGEWVLAMGSPLNLKNTVTAGIVSNIHRAGKELGLNYSEKRDMEYIQTDAMINVGNSGGPLVNLDGEVIGVNSMMASAGIGFAIPIDYVKDFLDRLRIALKDIEKQGSKPGLRSPHVKRRYIGITMLTLTEDIASQLSLRDSNFPDVNEGVLVHRVQFNSPADIAGMKDNDVIMKINGRTIYTTQDVFQALKTNGVLEMIVRRGTANVNITIEPEDIM